MRIAVCALTFRRPVGLQRLLDALIHTETPAGSTVCVIIVDNDAKQSGRSIVDDMGRHAGLEIEYYCQPAQNISLARNTAVEAARDWNADVVCFIDDDEWPNREWLRSLVSVQQRTGADVVTGPVLPVFDVPPPTWVLDGGFFDRPMYDDASELGYATTSNVLIRTACLVDEPGPFDPSFGLSGGEDTHLFARLRRRGCRIVWSQGAVVSESIPETRVDQRWILTREFRRGQTLSLTLRALDPSAARYLRRIINGFFHIVVGVTTTVIGLPFGRARRVTGLKRTVFGAGMISGLTGRRYEEYRVTHGT